MFLFDSTLYKRAPLSLKELMLASVMLGRRGLRFGGRFQEIRDELERTQWLQTDELKELQREYVRRTLKLAMEHVPFYRGQLHQMPSVLDSHDPFEILERFPLLDKRSVLEARTSILAKNFRGIKFKGATSGTTGLSLTGYRDLRSISFESAFLSRQLSWAGYRTGAPMAWMRGDKVVPIRQTEPPFWVFNRPENILMLSSFHLSERSAQSYIDELVRFDPLIIQAYPSSIAFLAKILESSGRVYGGSRLAGIVTSSETVTTETRERVQRAFGVRLFDWYGSFERNAAIGTCEHGSYHLLSDYSYVELMPRGEGHMEIVGTTFHNNLMPLIRYQIGDMIVPAPQTHRCACGRCFPVIDRIDGRMDDFVVTPDGRQIGMMAIVFDGLDYLLEGQIRQVAVDCLEIRLVPVRNLNARDFAALEGRVREIVGSKMAIRIKVVDSIPRSRAGKLQIVVRDAAVAM